jgi:hypothetical protein
MLNEQLGQWRGLMGEYEDQPELEPVDQLINHWLTSQKSPERLEDELACIES